MKSKQRLIPIAVLTIAVVLSGCGPRAAIVKDYYLIEATRSTPPLTQSAEVILKVVPFTIGAGYQSKGFVYSLGDQRFESEFYYEYFVPPSQMITDQTEQWLRSSKLFAQVLPATSLVEPTHLLEGDIRQIYYDIENDDDLKAVLDVTFYLVAKEGRRAAAVQFKKNYRVTHAFEKKSQQQAADAMAPCLTEVLENLEKDLTQHLNLN